MQQQIRSKVEPRDVPAWKAGRRLHLTEEQFISKLPELLQRGFPPADPTTGMFDLYAIDRWMDGRHALTGALHLRDARIVVDDRLARL
jgi:hypothetical protein